MPSDLPPHRPLRHSAGGQLSAENVIGRKLDAVRAFRSLEVASVRLNEPRRIGKTSLLTKMAAEPSPGWICVKQSFQGVKTIEEMATLAVTSLFKQQSLSKRSRDKLRQFFGGVAVGAQVDGVTLTLSPAFAREPLVALEAALVNVAAELPKDGRLLLAWDEVPDMVGEVDANQGADAAAHLLAVLRRLREEESMRSLRWLLTGSVGFHHILRGIDGGDALVGDLDNLPLDPLTEEWARWLAASLLMGAGLADDGPTASAVAETAGGIPYLCHLIVGYAARRGLPALAPGDVDAAFVAAVSDLDESHQSTHFLTRLEKYYGSDRAMAEWVLDRAAETPRTRGALEELARDARRGYVDADLRRILDWLLLDHYLVRSTHTPAVYAWRFEPLRRVWQIRRG